MNAIQCYYNSHWFSCDMRNKGFMLKVHIQSRVNCLLFAFVGKCLVTIALHCEKILKLMQAEFTFLLILPFFFFISRFLFSYASHQSHKLKVSATFLLFCIWNFIVYAHILCWHWRINSNDSDGYVFFFLRFYRVMQIMLYVSWIELCIFVENANWNALLLLLVRLTFNRKLYTFQ